MRTIYLSSQPDAVCEPSVATIGFFDGVHRGHRQLLSEVCKEAERCGLLSMAITFDSHPREVLHKDYQPQLLTTLDEKLVLLSKSGIDVCVVIPFTEQLAALSARQFMQQMLSERLHVRHLVVGYDHRFGHNRLEGADDYRRYAAELGISLSIAPVMHHKGRPVSSSRVRRLLSRGLVDSAEECLGHPYILFGTVVHGYQKGRELGFPTANISVDDERKLLPLRGVYAVKVRLEHSMRIHRAVMNIGMRPTFEGDRPTLEVHIIDFSEEIYGQKVMVALCHRMREERRFSSPEALVCQLRYDVSMVNELFDQELEKLEE